MRHVLFESLTLDTLTNVDIADGVQAGLHRGFVQFLDSLLQLGDARRFLLETWRMPADADGPFDHEAGVDLIAGLIRAGQETGELGTFDAQAMAVALTAASSELAFQALASGKRETAIEVIDRLLESMSPLAARAT